MKVAITGGLGFLGTHITSKLLDAGMEVTVFARSGDKDLLHAEFNYVRCDLAVEGVWQQVLSQHDAVINLAGANIFTRWNRQKKEEIYNSRIISTRNVVDGIKSKKSKVKVLLNASATGYYGLSGDDPVKESDGPGNDFLSMVCSNWEDEAMRAAGPGVRVAVMRFGTVFGSESGAFPKLWKNFRFMAGGRLGNGRQWFPWIHVDDAAGIALQMLKDKKMSGAYNCTSPGIVTNREFTAVMSEISGRPQLVPFIPGFMLRIILGEFGSFLVHGQKTLPERLLESGYGFMYPDLKSAVTALVK